MALKATVYKAELAVSDMDRNYYHTHQVTIAQHPSENDERMMVRLLAFALNASETLEFTRGLSADDEPELWQKSMIDEVELWIELGQPDEKRIRKACHKAKQVIIYTYQPRSAEVWWQQMKNKVTYFDNLAVYAIAQETVDKLVGMAERTMRLQCSVDGGQCWFGDDEAMVEVSMERWL
jgi:uncharacterized protein YaeQ